MAKDINNLEIEELLNSSKKVDVKKIIKLITKENLIEYLDKTFEILNEFISDPKMWETNCQIIEFLAINHYVKITPLLQSICNKNEPHDMITAVASKALCKIDRKSKNDVSKVFELLLFGKFAVSNGALKSVGQDKILPEDEEIEKLIKIVSNFDSKHEKGYSDIRMGLALACAGWDKSSNVIDFLHTCIDSSYSPLQKVAANSFKNKYSEITLFI
ncbi:hypothetical protein [Chryseobacterium sp.]|uniref:hypothetical protein n=1 Tax=Chryseobacterium sp. TaxID=1871047 RepID=UPI00289E7A7D|nr:hypothetical protein [Chryseobacterium sp.]